MEPSTAAKILERIAQGESLRKICAEDMMPRQPTIYRWIQENDEFRKQYARAREQQAEAYADEIVDIADNEPDHNKARVRIDARKWHASKLAPKKYGDRLDLEHGGSVGLTVKIVRYADRDNAAERLEPEAVPTPAVDVS